MTPKFTPGPWRACPVQGVDYDFRPIARDVSHGAAPYHARVDYTGDEAETDANANLIAAAPDLYAALEMLLNDGVIDAAIMEPGRVSIARAALKKARGER
jgi:hypothetical protein